MKWKEWEWKYQEMKGCYSKFLRILFARQLYHLPNSFWDKVSELTVSSIHTTHSAIGKVFAFGISSSCGVSGGALGCGTGECDASGFSSDLFACAFTSSKYSFIALKIPARSASCVTPVWRNYIIKISNKQSSTNTRIQCIFKCCTLFTWINNWRFRIQSLKIYLCKMIQKLNKTSIIKEQKLALNTLKFTKFKFKYGWKFILLLAKCMIIYISVKL